MRLLTWNCNGALRRKFFALDVFQADVLCLQECEDPGQSLDADYRAWAGSAYRWTPGAHPAKGLGVFWRGPGALRRRPAAGRIGEYFLPVTLPAPGPRPIPLCAVWAHQTPVEHRAYIGQLHAYFTPPPRWLSDPLCLLAGDFNSNATFDRPGSARGHQALVARLARRGLRSAYHEAEGLAHGQERHPTFFLHRNAARPFHIDYVFIGPGWAVADYALGHAKHWRALSDHLPFCVDLAPRPSLG